MALVVQSSKLYGGMSEMNKHVTNAEEYAAVARQRCPHKLMYYVSITVNSMLIYNLLSSETVICMIIPVLHQVY